MRHKDLDSKMKVLWLKTLCITFQNILRGETKTSYFWGPNKI